MSISSIYREELFQNKTALITGGGTGIGLRIARELAMLGAHVILVSRKVEVVTEAAKEIQKAGGSASALACNIRDPKSIEDCFNQIEKIDYLVNNAGGQFPAPASDIPEKGWNAVIETNLSGTFFMCQEAFKKCFQSNGGKIVSIIANMWNGFPYMAHTGAARAGVENLTKTLSTEWGRYGVTVNAVAPGVIHSSGLETYDDHFKKMVFSTSKNNQTARLGTEAEVAAAVLFLLSPAAQYITGETLKVDGGESLYHPLMPPVEHQNLKAELE